MNLHSVPHPRPDITRDQERAILGFFHMEGRDWEILVRRTPLGNADDIRYRRAGREMHGNRLNHRYDIDYYKHYCERGAKIDWNDPRIQLVDE